MRICQKLVILFIVAWLITAPEAGAQFLPLDSLGKCHLSEVVVADGFAGSLLFKNGLTWVKALPAGEGKLSATVLDSVNGKISGSFEFPVYAQSGILKKMAGSISYQFAVETKEGKYRYAFTGFVFHYFTQDRNYRMVKTGKTKRLEDLYASGWQKLWSAHRAAAYQRISRQVQDLNSRMKLMPVKADSTAKMKKVDW